MTTRREAELLQQLHAAETKLTHLRGCALLAIDCRKRGDVFGEAVQTDLVLTALAGAAAVGVVAPLEAAAEALSSMRVAANDLSPAERYDAWLAERDADDRAEAEESRREDRGWDAAEAMAAFGGVP